MLFEVPLPSPLGRVAERSEVGRGSLPPCISFAFPQTKAQKPLPSALRAATFPKGEGKRKAHHNFKQQFTFQNKKDTPEVWGFRGGEVCGYTYWRKKAALSSLQAVASGRAMFT